MNASPYKFLAPYLLEDEAIFFGRTRETEILLADIVINPLVVLFAKTGTGKTSLINAGVRPRLHDRDYDTFFIRVRKGDPIASARNELAGYSLPDDVFSQQLVKLSEKLGKSVILFFDQFEEFFIHVGGNSRIGREFIAEIGKLHKNEDSGVHIVFSMREEFLYFMDYFRAEIPSVFHNDSTLRLRGFDRAQAEEAIVGPARHFGYEFEAELVKRLIDDLIASGRNEESRDDEIEPTQLQVVCDTMWQHKDGSPISVEDYVGLGVQEETSNVAEQILDKRLRGELTALEDDNQLRLLARLLPLLRTDKNTKDIRDVNGLCQALGVDRATLDPLLTTLKNSRLIQESGTSDVTLIELTHDYLADGKRIATLQDSARSLWLERIRKGAGSVSPEDLEEISHNKSTWRLSQAQAAFLFRSALTHGWDLREWFDVAQEHGVGVWEILREKIDGRDEVEAVNVVDLARELSDVSAIKLLARAMEKASLAALAGPALAASAQSRNSDVAAEAKKILAQREQASKANAARKDIRETRPETSVRYYSPPADARSSLQPPYALLSEQLLDGEIIPFIGPSASLAGRPAGVLWQRGMTEFLPTVDELADYLAEQVQFPFRELRDLSSIAQYFSVTVGRKALYETLHDIFDQDYELTPVYTFLARIPKPRLMITTNYDDLIERALSQENRPYDLVIHTADVGSGDQLLWWRYGESEPREVSPNKLDVDLQERTIIYKMHGAVNRRNRFRDQYVITEDDYIDFLARMAKNRAIPAVFAEALQRCHFLFLGYRLFDWHSRLVLNRLERDLRRSKSIRSWAIQFNPSVLEAHYWNARGVNLYDMSIDDFVSRLSVS